MLPIDRTFARSFGLEFSDETLTGIVTHQKRHGAVSRGNRTLMRHSRQPGSGHWIPGGVLSGTLGSRVARRTSLSGLGPPLSPASLRLRIPS